MDTLINFFISNFWYILTLLMLFRVDKYGAAFLCAIWTFVVSPKWRLVWAVILLLLYAIGNASSHDTSAPVDRRSDPDYD